MGYLKGGIIRGTTFKAPLAPRSGAPKVLYPWTPPFYLIKIIEGVK